MGMCHPVGHSFWGFRSLNSLLIFICPILKYGEGFRFIKNKHESEISRSNVLPRKLTMLSSRSFVVILVTTFPAFQPQGACEARVLINSLPWRERRKPATEYSKSWLEIPDKSRAWREILTRNSESKEERMCSFSLARNPDSKSDSKY